MMDTLDFRNVARLAGVFIAALLAIWAFEFLVEGVASGQIDPFVLGLLGGTALVVIGWYYGVASKDTE